MSVARSLAAGVIARWPRSSPNAAEERPGRPIQAGIREPDWLRAGSGAFHDTVTGRPLIKLALGES